MSVSPVPDSLLVCVHCPPAAAGRPPVVRFRHEQDQVRCPRCRHWYRVVTRALAAPTTQEPREEGTSRYRLVTAERGGRPLERVISAPPGLRLAIGERVSLVYSGGRLIGVANQTSATWFPVPASRSGRGARGLELSLFAVAALGCALVAAALAGAVSAQPAAGALTGLLLGGICLPFLVDLLRGDPGQAASSPSGPAGQKGSGERPPA